MVWKEFFIFLFLSSGKDTRERLPFGKLGWGVCLRDGGCKDIYRTTLLDYEITVRRSSKILSIPVRKAKSRLFE